MLSRRTSAMVRPTRQVVAEMVSPGALFCFLTIGLLGNAANEKIVSRRRLDMQCLVTRGFRSRRSLRTRISWYIFNPNGLVLHNKKKECTLVYSSLPYCTPVYSSVITSTRKNTLKTRTQSDALNLQRADPGGLGNPGRAPRETQGTVRQSGSRGFWGKQ